MVTLAEELPFAIVARDEQLDLVCSGCFALKSDVPIYRCIGCRVVNYCGNDCQKKDWPNHKHECSFLLKYSPRIPSKMCRLIARVILKLRRKDGAQDRGFNGRVFAELMDHGDDIQKNPKEAVYLANIIPILREYMGEKYAPNPELILSVYGKIVINSFNIDDIGKGLYLGLSIHNHSCDPDAFVSFNGVKAVLRSADKNQIYSKDPTIRYIDLLQSTKDRKEKLLDQYYFTCACKVCSDPTMEFMYNSARSRCCPDSYCPLDPKAEEMTCHQCGSRSGITVEEAVGANERIVLIGSMMEQWKEKFDKSYYLMGLIDCYESFSTRLSPFNLNLLLINDRLFHTAFELGDIEAGQKYGPLLLPAYRRYLTLGNSDLSVRLMQIAQLNSQNAAPSKSILEGFEEAYTANLVSHGPVHFNTMTMKRFASSYRALLQLNKRS